MDRQAGNSARSFNPGSSARWPSGAAARRGLSRSATYAAAIVQPSNRTSSAGLRCDHNRKQVPVGFMHSALRALPRIAGIPCEQPQPIHDRVPPFRPFHIDCHA
jgi:hypothetical protein